MYFPSLCCYLCHCDFLRYFFFISQISHSLLLVTPPHICQVTGRCSNSDAIDKSERQTDCELRSPRGSKSYRSDFLSGCHGLYKLQLCGVIGPAGLASVSVVISVFYKPLFASQG